MIKTVIKLFFTLVISICGYYLFIACTEPEIADPNAPCTGEIMRDLTFGIINVAIVPNWCNSNDPAPICNIAPCLEEPSEDKYKVDGEQARHFNRLVSDEPYTVFGKTFWFQYGIDGQTICSDDNVNNEYPLIV